MRVLKSKKKSWYIWYNRAGDTMINYPNGKKAVEQRQKFVEKANLGSSLEDDLNKTNLFYRQHGVALIYKKPTPIQIVKVEYPARSKAKIVEAYYKQASTTDYNGVYKGFAIDFEAKSTKNKTRIPLKTIHEHQIEHLRQVSYHKGHAYLIIRFSVYDETYLLEFESFERYLNEVKMRSIPYEWIKENAYLCKTTFLKPCDYIGGIEASLQKKGVMTHEQENN